MDFWLYRSIDKESLYSEPEMAMSNIQALDHVSLDKVYRSLLYNLKLSQEHRENLLHRGLSLDEIQRRGYKTLPLKGRAKIAKKLIDKFGSEICISVPGIYLKRDEDNQFWSIAGPPGLLIPGRNLYGQIISLKIRRDDKGDGSRYLYLSSKKHGGLGSGAHVHRSLYEGGSTDIFCLTEGELKSDILTTLSGIPTISIPGVGAWRQGIEALKWLEAKIVRLAFDMDAGHNITVARALKNTINTLTKEGFTVELETWDEADGKGLDDLLVGGKTPEVITGDDALNAAEEILKTAETLKPAPLKKDNGKPSINAGYQDLQTVTEQAIGALEKANSKNLYLFLHGGPVRIEFNELDQPTTRNLTLDRVRYESARVANWFKLNSKGEQEPAKPPVDICKNILASPALPFPTLESITCVPTFGPDGVLELAKGYHAGSRTYYIPADGLVIPEVPAKPMQIDIDCAKELILDNLLIDFPFASQSDRAHAMALLLLPFVRPMVEGPTVLHLIEASSQGSGKGLLAEVLMYISLGWAIGVIPPPEDNDELRKSITSMLIQGCPAVLLDNVYSLKLSTLDAALTATVWKDRILGKSENIELPIRWIWVATGNNVTVSTDTARRSIRIRLTPSTDKPWLRNDFKHPDLQAWVAEHRGELIWAALTMIQGWIRAGKPAAKVTNLGTFSSWAKTIGGILEYAGVEGFMKNALQFYEAADTEGTIWRQFVAVWWAKFNNRPVGVSDLFPLAVSIEGFDMGKGSTERAQKTAFGMKLARQKDRIFDNKRIESAGTERRAQLWRLNLGEHVGTLRTHDNVLAFPLSDFQDSENDNNKNINTYRGERVHQGSPGSQSHTDTNNPLKNPENGTATAFSDIQDEMSDEELLRNKAW